MSKPKKQDIKKLLAEAQLPKQLVAVCTRGDLILEAQRIEDQLADLSKPRGAGPSRLSGPKSGSVQLARQLEAVRDKMRAATIEFELQAYSSIRWRELKAAHPMGKEPSELDVQFSANVESLMQVAIRESVVSPELDDDDWAQLAEVLVNGEWNKFAIAVLTLNEEGTSVPFSLLASAILQAQSDDSESRETRDERPA